MNEGQGGGAVGQVRGAGVRGAYRGCGRVVYLACVGGEQGVMIHKYGPDPIHHLTG